MLLSGLKQATGLLSSSSTRRAAASVLPHFSGTHKPARCSTAAMSLNDDAVGVTAEPAAANSESKAAAAGLVVDAAAESTTKKVKRNVALHVGYVGTAYTGMMPLQYCFPKRHATPTAAVGKPPSGHQQLNQHHLEASE
jgi:hypothetical protein